MLKFDQPLGPDTHRELLRIKCRLLANGMKIAGMNLTAYDDHEPERVRRHTLPIRTRSGVSGGLDLVLPHNVYVNVPVIESFVHSSDLSLGQISDELFLISAEGSAIAEARLLPTPRYYTRRTADGAESMRRIGQMCSADRFCYGMTGPGCSFWPVAKRCRYCSIGNNYDADAARKHADQLLEVLGAALEDPIRPPKHVLLGGGTPSGEDMGAIMASDLCRKIKSRYDLPIYVMIVAPLKNEYIDRLLDAGADELGLNIEFWSDDAWKAFIPGKREVVGKTRFLDALEYAVSRFGPINTRSILIAGLEDRTFTLQGTRHLASMGVMPIISPFRSLDGTMLTGHSGFNAGEYATLFAELTATVRDHNIPLGPTCVCCQNNTLALPFGPAYRLY